MTLIIKPVKPIGLWFYQRLKQLFILLQSETFDTLLSSGIVEKYRNLVLYLENICQCKESRVLDFSCNLLIGGNNTKNHTEAPFPAIKDLLLQKIKE